MENLRILITKPSKDYELIDSGEGEKLERFGSIVLSRPDPQALWRKKMNEKEWKKADGIFTRTATEGEWKMKKGTPDSWNIDFGNLKFKIKPTAFKHTGLFPEQLANWEWLQEIIKEELAIKGENSIEILNLFGYTGGATLACAKAGAKIVHIDSSKSTIAWARENAKISLLFDKPIRWILEDARVFVNREIKRGNKYSGIIMDPPAFGHGVNKEIWKIEEDFLTLVEDCIKLLNDKPLFFLINGYSSGYSAIAYENVLKILIEKFGGNIEMGELAIEESEAIKNNNKNSAKNNRLLPCGIFARWKSTAVPLNSNQP